MSDAKLEFELKISNDARALGTVEAFLREVLRHASLSQEFHDGLAQLARTAAEDAIAQAYPKGESGAIVISSAQDAHHLVITVRDRGLPQDVRKLERALHEKTDAARKQTSGLDWTHLADEVHWIGYGPEGKALQIIKWLHETPITEHAQRGDLSGFVEKPPHAPEQEYTIRRMRPEEAVQVSQLMYRAYGGSYFNADVYYPDRVAGMNERGELLSFVAAGADGRLAGHYALERNQEGPVMEGGQAVVDPAHRGRHLMERMKDAAVSTAKDLGLIGIFGDAVTVHTASQKMNISHGARLGCVNLGISPQNEVFRGLAQSSQPQRVTCVLYFQWLKDPVEREVFAPARYRDALAKIYANLQCPVRFGKPTVASGHGELRIRLNKSAGRAFLCAEKTGEDSIASMRHAKRELVERSHAEVVFADLPLWEPGTPAIAEALWEEGFSFCGVAPHFSTGGDILRMAYLTVEMAREPIHVEEPIAHWLVDYALEDRRQAMTRE